MSCPRTSAPQRRRTSGPAAKGAGLLAVEAGRVVAVALAVIDGFVRIRTQRPGAIDLAGALMRRNHAVGRSAMLHPGVQRADGVKRVRAGAAPAVRDTRC